MRVFLAGATGVIGGPLVRRLLDAGHQVVGSTRSAARLPDLAARGVEGVVLNAFDAAAVERVLAEARPEVVIHQLTALPRAPSPLALRAGLAETNRLRRETVPVFARAAAAAGARRLVVQSISFVTRPEGPDVLDETAPLWLDGPKAVSGAVAAVADMEAAALSAPGLDTLVLRYGFFYGPGTWYASDGAMVQAIRGRLYPDVGEGGGRLAFVHVDDAADATMLAVNRGHPGIYNVTDAEPALHREWLAEMVRWLNAPRPRHVSPWLARLVAGAAIVHYATTLRGASSARARQAFGWNPRPWRAGFRHLLGQ